jgi:hypothetical protein
LVGGNSLLHPGQTLDLETKKERKYMTKNMTRKGLALGSIAALVIGSLVGAAPAQANDTVSLNAAFGTTAQKAAT